MLYFELVETVLSVIRLLKIKMFLIQCKVRNKTNMLQQLLDGF